MRHKYNCCGSQAFSVQDSTGGAGKLIARGVINKAGAIELIAVTSIVDGTLHRNTSDDAIILAGSRRIAV